jgi:hypothetical protein
MKRRTQYTLMLIALCMLIGGSLFWSVSRAQVLSPRPEELRFQVLLHEPVAAPDRRSVVAGTDALLIKDRRAGQCYVAISVGQSLAMTASACEE